MFNINDKKVLQDLPVLENLAQYDVNDPECLAELVMAATADASKCVNIVGTNCSAYVDCVNELKEDIFTGKITCLQDNAFTVMLSAYEFLHRQAASLHTRYDDLRGILSLPNDVDAKLFEMDTTFKLGFFEGTSEENTPKMVFECAKYCLGSDDETTLNDMKGAEAFSQSATNNSVYQAPANQTRSSLNNDPNSKFQFVRSNKTFADVAGLHEVKRDLMQIVDFIKYPDKYKKFGAKLPKGTILCGPPGTGKTLLAKAIAGEADANFIALCSTDLTASTWGAVPKMINELFEKARQNAPCVIFIDEIDMLGMQRDTGANSLVHRETLNAFLSAVDGFNECEGVTLLAATNRLQDLDSAFVRPGRFDNIYTVPLPGSVDEVKEVVDIYMKNKQFDNGLNRDNMAIRFLRYSPAAIESVLNEACLIAIRTNNGIIRECDLSEAIVKKAIHGHVKDIQDVSEEETRIVAYHEAGHAVAALANGIGVQSVSIMGTTTGAGGLTMMEPDKKSFYRKSDFEAKLMIDYGGRAAEEVVFGADMITTGASCDIRSATEMIKYAAANFGFDMSESNKPVPVICYDADGLSKKVIEKAALLYYGKTVDVIKAHRNALEAIAQELMKKGVITGSETLKLFNTCDQPVMRNRFNIDVEM